MNADVRLDARYAPSQDVVAREIEGEIIIVPLTSGIGDMEDELFTLNETGRAIWKRLDGHKTLAEVAADLATEFDAPAADIERDVNGFAAELLKRRMLVDTAGG
jgi:coenzyme PQQ biosynthesis protein PqqD